MTMNKKQIVALCKVASYAILVALISVLLALCVLGAFSVGILTGVLVVLIISAMVYVGIRSARRNDAKQGNLKS